LNRRVDQLARVAPWQPDDHVYRSTHTVVCSYDSDAERHPGNLRPGEAEQAMPTARRVDEGRRDGKGDSVI
jgi:hypothetical protein